MKIINVEVFVSSYAIDDVPRRVRSFALVKLTTDDGICGWGEASDCYGHSNPRTVEALFEETLKWLLLDQDPLRGSELITDVRRRVYPTLGERGLVMQAISACDIALWDIRGKEAGKPICDLIGAHRTDIPIYAAGKPEFRVAGDEYCGEVFADLLARGARAVKVRPGVSLEWDTAFLQEVRASLPPEVGILVDGKYNYNPISARRLGRVLEDIGALAFEEPLVAGNLDQIARLAADVGVPLAYGEHCFTLHDFRNLIVSGAAAIAEPDVTICGGISEFLRVGALCEAFGVEVMPHCGGLTAIGMAANLHAAATLRDCGLFEFDARSDQPLRDRLVADAPIAADKIDDGRMPVPSRPGLGIDVIEEVLLEYPYYLDESVARSFPVYGTPHV